MPPKRSGLGKGLDALFLDNNTEDKAITTLKLSELEPNKSQPRVSFNEEALRELADSIRTHGVLQPLIVRPMDGGYQIVAGERRWRAAMMAGLSEVPVVIRQFGDDQTLEVAIIENLQREDLNAIELAFGYQSLIDLYGFSQEEAATRLGKSRPVVANTIRLLGLPPSAQEHVKSGKISIGHAKALLALEDDALIEEIAEKVATGNILVRDIEKMARERKKAQAKEGGQAPPKTGEPLDPTWGDNYHKEMEIALSAELGTKVRIVAKGNKSTLELDFYSNEELADIAARLTKTDI